MYLPILLFVIIATAHTQRVSNGQCNFNNLVYQHNTNSLDLRNLYEIRRIHNNWNAGQCASWQFTTRNNSMFMTSREVVNRRLIQRNSITRRNSDGSLRASFSGLVSDFTFLATGRDYAVLYACTNQGVLKQEYLWALGRKNTISQSARREIQRVLQNNKLTNARWTDISHSRQSCRTSGANNITLSPIIVLIVGYLISKEVIFVI